MRRATITIPDGLDEEVDQFRENQAARPSLTAIVQAALESYLRGGAPHRRAPSLVERLLRHRGDIRRIASTHGGSNLRLFGSVARGEAGAESDVDLLVDLKPGRSLFDLAAMRAELEDLLGASVDVVTSSGLEGELRDEILAEALTL